MLGCSSKPTQNAESKKTHQNANLDDPKLAVYAKDFDRFLNGKLTPKELTTLKGECEHSDQNPFCFSILQKETLEESITKNNGSKLFRKHGHHTVRPKFARTRLLNWKDLRFASVPAIIRGLHSLSKTEIEHLKKRALFEDNCPNNAVIALGAFLEDRLPDRITLKEIATLYEKGAHCPQSSANDQEILLTRAGLFHFADKNYFQAEILLKQAVRSEASFRARSLYWLFRTQSELSQKKASLATLAELTQNYPFSFHSIVALTADKKDPGEILEKTNFNFQTRSEKNTSINRLIEQVEILHKHGYRQSASKVLGWAINETQGGIEPEMLVYLSDLRGEQGDYLGGISLLSNVLYDNPELISRSTMERYFPRPFFPIFENNAQGIDPYLLMSIARRESAFNARAISSANAQGLLQLTPGTLRDMGLKKDLMDPESNVMAGSRYISELLARVNGQVHLALAAYNAGPSRLSEWTTRYPLQEPVLFIDLIPYRETREYVAAVLRNYYWYRRIHENTNNIGLLDYKLTRPN